MSSDDRGLTTTDDAEMQLSNTTLVTMATKTTGLNPNANVFHIKGPTTPPSSLAGGTVEGTSLDTEASEEGTLPEWPPTPNPTPQDVDAMNNVVLPTTTDSFAYMNGDAGKSPPAVGVGTPSPGVATFPPTPESPLSVGQADYSGLNGSLDGQVLFPAGAEGTHDENNPLDGNVPDDQLRALLKSQLEYYFSRENLANDSYLVSQMDADQYVSITTIAGFNQVKKLTNNLALVIEVLRESAHVQVDEVGDKVRPLNKRCIVILREVPDSTPVDAVQKLFQGKNCPPFISCEFAHNDNWYVTFESEEEAQKAYRYLREEVGTFLGKPIMARIKAKPLLRSSFVPKNGFKQSYETGGVFNQPQQKFQFSQGSVTSVPFIASPQINNVGYPFFTPNAPTPTVPSVQSPNIPQVWPTAQLAYFDPGTAFAANGYTASGAIKLPTSSSRHGFQNMRNNRTQKPHRGSSSSNREQGNSQSERSEHLSESDHVDHDPRDRLGGPSREYMPRDRPDRDRDRQTYHDRHQGTPGRGSRSEGSSSSHHYQHSSATPSNSMRHHEGRGHQHMHHAHGGSGSAHGQTSGSGGPPLHGSHNHGPHGHGGPHSYSHSHSQSHPHSHPSSHMSSTERERGGRTDRESTSSSSGLGPRHSSLSDVSKEQFSQPLSRRGGGSYRGRRRPRGHDENGANRSSSSSSQSAKDKPSCDPPNFDLADTSFPPLPGSSNNTSSNEVFENKMSDVVKGTAKPSTREAPKPVTSSIQSIVAPVASTLTEPLSPPPEPKSPNKDTGPTPTSSQSTVATLASVVAASVMATNTNNATPTSASSCSTSPTSPPYSPLKLSKPTSAEIATSPAPTAPSVPSPTTASAQAGSTHGIASHTPSQKSSTSAQKNTNTSQGSCTPQASAAVTQRSCTSSQASTPQSSSAHTPDSASVSTQTSTAALTPSASTSTNSGSAKSVSTQAGSNVLSDGGDSQDESKSAKKLSYAQMAQRGKEKAGPVDKPKTDECVVKDPGSPPAGATTGSTGTTAVTKETPTTATVSATAVGTGSGNGRPAAQDYRRDDTREPRTFGTRRPRDFNFRRDDYRKDRNGRDFDRDRENRSTTSGYFRDRDGNRDRKSSRDFDRIRGK